jgi:hypothetical protein
MKRMLLSLSLLIVTSATPLMSMQNDSSDNYCDILRVTVCYCSVAVCRCLPNKSVSIISIKAPYKDCGGCTLCGVACHVNPNCGGDSSNSTSVGIMK